MPAYNLVHMPTRRIGALERPGCRLHYEVTGSGPAIVFMHGLGGNHLSWWQQVAHFARSNTCVTLAARGFAPSSPLTGGPIPADFAGDLEALIDHLKLSKPALIGQSMGGWGAVEYALANPGKVRALVLAATTGTIDPRQMDGPERARLDDWLVTSAARNEACKAAGIHVAAGARMAAEQPALLLLYIAAILNGADNRNIGAWSSNALLFQFLNQAGLGKARGRLRKMLGRLQIMQV